MEAFATRRWPAAPPVLPQLLGARSPFQACPRRPGRGGWGAGLASGGAQFTCPVSGFVDPLILQPCFSPLHACLSALAPVHQVQVPVRRLPPLCRFFSTWGREGTGQCLKSLGAVPCPRCWPHRGTAPLLVFPSWLFQLLCCPCWDLLARESPGGTPNAPIRSVSPPNARSTSVSC